MRFRRGPVLIAACAVLAVAPAAPAAAVSSPTDTQQQVEADRSIPVPDTKSCTEQVSVHDFGNSYGAPDRSTYTPPTDCPGPWSKVVLKLTSTVDGVQFDRDVYIAIGHAVLLDGSTSEPCCTGSNAVRWTVSRDVTAYTPIFTAPQPVVVELDNVNDSTYTGVYHTVVSLTFYETGPTAPAGAHPDAVYPISSSSTGGPMLTISSDGQRVGQQVYVTKNASRIVAEIYADAHGPCEEFWWSDPSNCAGTPYREVAVYVDGQLAGVAPAYPVTYTGADGPGLWEPIPSPRAWNLRPYDVDLTPFAGVFDSHGSDTVQLGILGTQLSSGDFWETAANLLVWIDHQPRPPLTGGLLAAVAPAAPTLDATGDPATGGEAAYHATASHALSFSGYVDSVSGPVVTTVRETLGATNTQAAAVEHGNWTWNATTTTDANGHETVTTTDATYSVSTAELASFTFTDDGSTSTTTDGEPQSSSTYAEKMTTADTSGLAFNGVEYERYGYSDSGGACYDRVITAQAGEVTANKMDKDCPGAALPGALVPAVLPESPGAALLAVAAVGAVLLVLIARRRRGRTVS